MRRAKGTGCITQMSNGRYKYRGLLRVGVNKNGNPKNKIFYGNTKREVENKINAYLNQDEPEIKEVLTFNDALDLLYHQSKKERVKQKTLSIIETTSRFSKKMGRGFNHKYFCKRGRRPISALGKRILIFSIAEIKELC